jgi:multiple sugar transport system substrate-binding protein
VKVELYNQMVRGKMSRRNVLKGAASAGALAAMGGAVPAFAGSHSSLRAEILKVPGVGMGSPHGCRLAKSWRNVLRPNERTGCRG